MTFVWKILRFATFTTTLLELIQGPQQLNENELIPIPDVWRERAVTSIFQRMIIGLRLFLSTSATDFNRINCQHEKILRVNNMIRSYMHGIIGLPYNKQHFRQLKDIEEKGNNLGNKNDWARLINLFHYPEL